MAAATMDELVAHHEHRIVVATYGATGLTPEGDEATVLNVAVECEDCSEVLLDRDADCADAVELHRLACHTGHEVAVVGQYGDGRLLYGWLVCTDCGHEILATAYGEFAMHAQVGTPGVRIPQAASRLDAGPPWASTRTASELAVLTSFLDRYAQIHGHDKAAKELGAIADNFLDNAHEYEKSGAFDPGLQRAHADHAQKLADLHTSLGHARELGYDDIPF